MESFKYLEGKYLVQYHPGHDSCSVIKLTLWLQDRCFIATYFDNTSDLNVGLDHLQDIDGLGVTARCAIFNNRDEALEFIQKLGKLQEVRKASSKFLLSDLIVVSPALMNERSEDDATEYD